MMFCHGVAADPALSGFLAWLSSRIAIDQEHSEVCAFET
jgi:hypothetical protein